MRIIRVGVMVLALILALTSIAAAGPDKSKPAKPAKIKIHTQGEIFCPAAALVFGDVGISPSRCYIVYVLPDGRGAPDPVDPLRGPLLGDRVADELAPAFALELAALFLARNLHDPDARRIPGEERHRQIRTGG